MKRLFSIIIVGIMFLTMGTAAYVEAIPYTIGSQNLKSTLMISGSTATCTSVFTAEGDDVSKVEITQSLEKHSYLWVWDTVGGEWNTSSNGGSISFNNKVTKLDSGTYRVKTVFNVTDKNGKTEKIMLYSAEKSLN